MHSHTHKPTDTQTHTHTDSGKHTETDTHTHTHTPGHLSSASSDWRPKYSLPCTLDTYPLWQCWCQTASRNLQPCLRLAWIMTVYLAGLRKPCWNGQQQSALSSDSSSSSFLQPLWHPVWDSVSSSSESNPLIDNPYKTMTPLTLARLLSRHKTASHRKYETPPECDCIYNKNTNKKYN